MGVGKIAIFHQNRRLFQKWYEIGPWLLGIINRKFQIADRSTLVLMTLSDLERWHASSHFSIGFL